MKSAQGSFGIITKEEFALSKFKIAVVTMLSFALTVTLFNIGSLTKASLAYADDNNLTPLSTAATIDPTKVIADSLDYVAAKYEEVGENSVFDVVTYERLQKSVLQKDGQSIILLASPRNASSQVTLKYINDVAKTNGIQKIYLFDPHLGGELGIDGTDITNPNAASAINALWTALKTEKTDGVKTAQLKHIDPDYVGEDTYLFIFDRSAGVDTASTVVADLLVKSSDVSAIVGDFGAAFKAKVGAVFAELGGATETRYSQYDFFADAYSSASPKIDAYEPTKTNFKLISVSSAQLIHILQTPGTHNILVSGSWCPDSRAAISYISENATRTDSSPVYVWDFRANGATSEVTYLKNDTISAKATAGWLGLKIINLLGVFDSGYSNTPSKNYPDGDASQAIQTSVTTSFRSPFLVQINKVAGQSVSIKKNWIHQIADYELPLNYNDPYVAAVGGAAVAYANGKVSQALLDYVANLSAPERLLDYELSSGSFTLAQKALGRAAIGEFFAETKAVGSQASNSVSTAVGNSDSGCGDDNDALDDVGGTRLIVNHGTSDYNVSKYDISITYDPDEPDTKAVIAGTTTITAKAARSLSTISLDFRDQAVVNSDVRVVVGGQQVGIKSIARPQDIGTDTTKFDIRLNTALAAGTQFAVTIPYTTGIIDSFVADGQSPQGFFKRNDGKGIAALGEPIGAPYWFPVNDTPADGAVYKITLIAPTAYTNISSGVRTSNTYSSGWRTTVWEVNKDTAPYQIFAYISNDVVELSGPASASYPIKSQAVQQVLVSSETGGKKVIPAVSFVNKTIYDANNNRARDKADTFYNKLPYYIGELEKIAGPYPGEAAGFVFDNLGNGQGTAASFGAIETKDRPFFQTANAAGEGTFIHEYAHQWFGDSVRIAAWEDLWLNEGFASYVTDLFYENTQGFNAQAKYQAVYNNTAANNAWWNYAPAKIEREGDLFGGASAAYSKGALALAALRTNVGDTDFFNILQGWVAANKGKAVSTVDFIAFAQKTADVNLSAWANDWLYGQVRPAAWPNYVASSAWNNNNDTDTGANNNADNNNANNNPKPDTSTQLSAPKDSQVATIKTLAKTKITKVKVGKKTLTITWAKAKKSAKVTHYKVQYKIKGTSKWKTKTVKSTKNSIKLTKLAKGKKYQVRVQVQKVAGKTVYKSNWSVIKLSHKIK